MLKKVKKLLKAINIKNIKAIFKYIKYHGFKGLFGTCINYLRFGKSVLDEYKAWINNNEPNQKELQEQRKYIPSQTIKFGIILEEQNEKILSEQTYSNYEIITMNSIEQTDCDYIALIGNHISLAPFTLYEIVKTIEYQNPILIYSDNDKIKEGKRTNPSFKPDFGEDTILSENYIGNFIFVKAKFLKQYKEILNNLNKDIFYDLILRISEKTNNIDHIPKVLYHIEEEQKVDEYVQKKIIQEHLQRINLEYQEVCNGQYSGQYKVNYKIVGNPKVSLVVPNKDHIEDLKKLISSVEKSTYENYELVIVENNSEKEETFEYYKQIKQNPKIRIAKYEINYFNYSAIVNFGVENAQGDYVILLNNDIEILTSDWIEQMLMYTQRKNVGICGIKLYFPDKSIQHAGVTIGTRGLAGHRAREIEEKDFKKDDYINIVQNLSAVTAACFMVEKNLYKEMLGFDEKLAVAFNDIDFCLKIRQAGYLIVYNPFAYGYHYESKSRGQDDSKEKQERFAKEYACFVKRWGQVINKGDPYYNKNYRLDTDLPRINYNKIQC